MFTNLNIQLFGSPAISIDEKDVFPRSKRSIALMAHLYLENRPVPRTSLLDLLWKNEEQPTDGAIRFFLHSFNKTLQNIITSTPESLTINKTIQLESDVIDFLALYNEASVEAYQTAIKSYTGNFLVGDSFRVSDTYTTWVEAQQVKLYEKLDFMYKEVIEFLLTKGKRSSDLEEAILLTKKYSSLFPWSDNMILKSGLIYVKQKQASKALDVLIKHEHKLQKEFSLPLPQELAVVKTALVTNQPENIIVQYPQYFS